MSKATVSKRMISDVMRELGRKGGKAKSKKKTAAARKNLTRANRSLKKLFPKD